MNRLSPSVERNLAVSLGWVVYQIGLPSSSALFVCEVERSHLNQYVGEWEVKCATPANIELNRLRFRICVSLTEQDWLVLC